MDEHDSTVILEPTSAPRVVLVIVCELLLIIGGTYGAWFFCGRPGLQDSKAVVLPTPDSEDIQSSPPPPVITTGPAAPNRDDAGLDGAGFDPQLRVVYDRPHFGLEAILLVEVDEEKPPRLTRDTHGRTNRTTIRLDGHARRYGQAPGAWLPTTRREGRFVCGWEYPEKVRVTQTVMLVPNAFTRKLDTCLVHYRLENRDQEAHRVELSFSLDTGIDCQTSPLAVEGWAAFLKEDMEWTGNRVPRFAQALQRAQLPDPGLAYHLGLRLTGTGPGEGFRLDRADPELEGPAGVRFKMQDNVGEPGRHWRVTLRWDEQNMEPGSTRVLAFTYGVNPVEAADDTLAVSYHRNLDMRDGYAVIAWVRGEDRTIRLKLPAQLTTAARAAVEVPGRPEEMGCVSWPIGVQPRTRPDAYEVLAGNGTVGIKVFVPIQRVFGPWEH